MSEKTEYKVMERGTVMQETYRTEAAAIKAAKVAPVEHEAKVFMVSTSGTYRGETMVWPTVGNTYSR